MKIVTHEERLMDNKVHEKKIGDSASLRGEHLKDLQELEEKIRKLCPLEYCSYDIVRFSKPYFREFSYTEMLGGIYVSPTSSEIAVQLAAYAIENPVDEIDPCIEPFIASRLQKYNTLDKYKLDRNISIPNAKRVVFVPGSNIFSDTVSKELLARLLWENEDVYVKFHPFTHEGTIRALCSDFGYDRFIDPKESGWEYLANAEEVWSTSTSEMGLYAVLFDKPVHNIGNFFTEHRGAFYPFFRFIADKPLEEAKENLVRLLSSPYSGFFMPNDPNVDEKIKVFYEKAMELRKPHKPMIFESSNLQVIQKEIPREMRKD